MIDDEKLYSWIDGELSPDEAARIEAAVSADPALRAKADAQRALRERLRAAFAPIADSPAPEAMVAHIRGARMADVVDLDTERARRAPPPAAPLRRWSAIAASLIAGLIGGYALNIAPQGPAVERDGAMMASSALAKALDHQLASAPTDGEVKVQLTFRDTTGRLCRSFSSDATTGVACREGNDWAVRALFGRAAAKEGAYRQASTSDARVAAYMDSIIQGEVFDASQEREARAAGWQ